jgi:competence protein ComEA
MLKDLSREQLLIILGLILAILAGLAVMGFRRLSDDNTGEIIIDNPEENTVPLRQEAKIVVHVAGAVEREGVYKLHFGDRIIDAIELAGGEKSNANLSLINLAEKVKDGQKITVPVKRVVVERGSGDPVIRGSGTAVVEENGAEKININSASEKDFCKVKGIGPATAKKIIDFRTENGAFSKIEDIMKVKGIGKGKFNTIKENIII